MQEGQEQIIAEHVMYIKRLIILLAHQREELTIATFVCSIISMCFFNVQ